MLIILNNMVLVTEYDSNTMVFNQDMLMMVPLLITDIDAIRGRWQQLIDNNLLCNNMTSEVGGLYLCH